MNLEQRLAAEVAILSASSDTEVIVRSLLSFANDWENEHHIKQVQRLRAEIDALERLLIDAGIFNRGE